MEKAASMRLNEVFAALNASPDGLTTEEAKSRLKKYGFNTLVEKKATPFSYKFLAHFKDLFGVLLLFASALSAISGLWELSLIILGVVLLNIFFSLFQEARMPVPKLVKNGIYSHFALLTCSLFPFAVQAPRSDLNARKGIKTIFYHFRNKHARIYFMMLKAWKKLQIRL